MKPLPASWAHVLGSELSSPYFADLERFVAEERRHHNVYPPDDQVFAAFEHTPFDAVKVVLLGQDPYHGPGQAHGLCLSVLPGVAPPPSLANMLEELATDIGCTKPDHGCLESWANQGVLLLNTVLTVREGEAGSHQGHGWERFTDAVIRALDARREPVVFALWGNQAKKKANLVKGSQHRVVLGVHPSPLSAYAGFFGSKPFSAIDNALREVGHSPIQWQLDDRGVPIVRAKTKGRSASARGRLDRRARRPRS
jgi:uracil-DNA glycosylase